MEINFPLRQSPFKIVLLRNKDIIVRYLVMNLPKCCTTVTPLSKTLAMILFVALPFAGFKLGQEYQKTLEPSSLSEKQITTSKITPDLTSDDTAVASKNNIVPENNTIYFGKYEGQEALFLNNQVIFSDRKKNKAGYFGNLENTVKILSGLFYVHGYENFLTDSTKEYLYLPVIYQKEKDNFDNLVNKILQVKLSDLSVKELWSNPLGSMKYPCKECGRNIRGGATLSQITDKYLVFDLFSGFESDGMFAGTIILNINSKVEKYHEMITNVRINLKENSYSFEKLMPQKETCEVQNDYGCDENGQRDVYKPTGEIFTNALP
jgi:hypothetical protein